MIRGEKRKGGRKSEIRSDERKRKGIEMSEANREK